MYVPEEPWDIAGVAFVHGPVVGGPQHFHVGGDGVPTAFAFAEVYLEILQERRGEFLERDVPAAGEPGRTNCTRFGRRGPYPIVRSL